ncbi:hypothetical protein HA051_06080 [Chromobacterium vaccinii]|nr:hypothetical protein [Chromobacterium vaccinii]
MQSNRQMVRLLAPKCFLLHKPETRKRVIAFLSLLRQAYTTKDVSICLDFRRTEKLFACATLLLVAELDRLRRLFPTVQLRTHLPQNHIVRQVLQQVGFLKLVGHKHVQSPDDFDKSVRYWRYATGHQIDPSRIGDDVWSAMDGLITPALSRSMYKGISEAMTNSVHHAYVGPREDGINVSNVEKRWWMFSQELDGHLQVAICDLGIGIQRSLPREEETTPGFMQLLDKYLAPFQRDKREVAMIKAAIEIGKTRTGLSNRGKGLRQIVDAIMQAGDGASMVISSNSGTYRVESASYLKVGKETMIQYSDSIMGTLIQWKVPVNSQEA